MSKSLEETLSEFLAQHPELTIDNTTVIMVKDGRMVRECTEGNTVLVCNQIKSLKEGTDGSIPRTSHHREA
jgi:hypothetical protein